MSAEATAAERPRRADAVRNRERVIRAAEEVFAERGLDASVPEIAARAGVGKATVYRSFPSKEHLIAALACERVDWVTAQARAALAEEDAGAALEAAVATIAERQVEDCSIVASVVSEIRTAELDAARAAAHAALEELVARGRAQGALRDDATGEDLRVLFSGVASVLRDRGEADPTVWRRYGRLIVDALRKR